MIGISKIATYLPDNFETSSYIAAQTGIPEEVVQKKMGIIKKCRAPKSLQPSAMAIGAARKIFEEENIDPMSIDLIIWTGSEHKDHPVWSAGIYVQEQLGCRNAYAFDMSARCSSNVLGLHVAKSMMTTDSNLNRILLLGGHRTGDLVNYKDSNARFLYNLSDGGSAILVERDGRNPILNAKIITDGSFSKDVIIPAGGTNLMMRDQITDADTYLTVPNVAEMRERLGERSLDNFLKVIKDSAQSSFEGPIDYLALLHMKYSIHKEILNQMELKEEQSYYLDHFGHFGAPDQVLSMILAEENNLIQGEKRVVLASAGIGYTWSAIAVDWKENVATKDSLHYHEVNL